MGRSSQEVQPEARGSALIFYASGWHDLVVSVAALQRPRLLFTREAT